MHNSIEVEITLRQITYNISNKHKISPRLFRFENPLCSFTIEYFE